MRIAGFDWDEGNHQKCQKHGVSVAEIEEVLQSSGLRILTLKRAILGLGVPVKENMCF